MKIRSSVVVAVVIGWVGIGSATAASPTIAVVKSAAAFGGSQVIAPGTWIEIYGVNLSVDTRTWAASDFNGLTAPTSLDGTSVTIGGQAAFVDYVSPGQMNAQVPSSVGTGQQQVVVMAPGGVSAAYAIAVTAVEPGLLAPSSFYVNGAQYAAAVFSDGTTFALPPGAVPGVTSRRARPGDVLTFYGIGFGPVTPQMPAGQTALGGTTLASGLEVMFGATKAQVTYDGLAPGTVGLYQINVVVPNVAGSDAVQVTFSVAGVIARQTLLYVPVQALGLTLVETFEDEITEQGTVELGDPAPAGGAVVSLSSSSSVAVVPAMVTVPAGASSAYFYTTIGAVNSQVIADITASYGGVSVTEPLIIAPVGGRVPNFTNLAINVNAVSATLPGLILTKISVFYLHSSQIGSCSIAGSQMPSTNLSRFSGSWQGWGSSGTTIMCDGFDPSQSMIESSQGQMASFTSGALYITLSPQATGSSGTVSGSFILTSFVGTFSGTFSGTYSIT
jgi:uncharacterized protein (TIGR03437 family)